jgi:hypothetical protein
MRVNDDCDRACSFVNDDHQHALSSHFDLNSLHYHEYHSNVLSRNMQLLRNFDTRCGVHQSFDRLLNNLGKCSGDPFADGSRTTLFHSHDQLARVLCDRVSNHSHFQRCDSVLTDQLHCQHSSYECDLHPEPRHFDDSPSESKSSQRLCSDLYVFEHICSILAYRNRLQFRHAGLLDHFDCTFRCQRLHNHFDRHDKPTRLHSNVRHHGVE